jgi:hypothetical protein
MGICFSTPQPKPVAKLPAQVPHHHRINTTAAGHAEQQRCHPPLGPQQTAAPPAAPQPEAARPVAPPAAAPQEDPAKVRGCDHSGKGSALNHTHTHAGVGSTVPVASRAGRSRLLVRLSHRGECPSTQRVDPPPQKKSHPIIRPPIQPQGYVLLQSMAMLSTNPLVALWEAADLIVTAAAADIVG